MDDLARAEYPAMLAHLQPTQAVNVLNDRVKRITRINTEIADWLQVTHWKLNKPLQERRRVEEQYVQGLRKLLTFKVPNHQSELGVFSGPWDKILQSVDATAHSHHLFSSQLDKDVEGPLRNFQSRKEMQNMQTISANLTAMARDLEEAQKKTDALTKKGPKTNAQKMADATAKLEQATQQWDSQAPFIFETLQALDEQRVNQLRDLLTQYQTHESDQAQRAQTKAADTLAAMLEISTEQEIASFKEKVVSGRPKMEKRVTTSRQSSGLPASQTLAPPPSSSGHHDDDTSDYSVPVENKTESKLRSRIGTMLGRRRQSIHGGFGPISPQKTGGGAPSFGRGLSSSHSNTHVRSGLSPRASSNNLAETNNRLSALQETPDSPRPPQSAGNDRPTTHEGTNGFGEVPESARLGSSAGTVNGTHDTDALDVPPPAGPPPSQAKEPEAKDSEGFTIPPPADDPISQAQREAAEDSEQMFKLNIQSSPIAEEDADAKEAALSNVANTLTQMAAPSRKMGTVRGRRDVRNTIYVPPPNVPELTNDNPFPTSPSLPSQSSKPTTVAALASEASIAATSDTQSIRSANSLMSLAHLKHPEMHEPGLNASIIETVSATFEDGEVKNAKVHGEIAFAYHATGDAAQDRETIRINNFPNLEVIGPNRIFVQNSSDKPDEFHLDVSHLNKTATAFTYRVHTGESGLGAHVPLLLRPAWKPQGDKLGLLLQYSLNPACKLTAPVTLQNVVLVATYEGAKASGAQTKPSGTHLKEKHLVYWRLGDLTLTAETQKIVCRIIGAENAEPKPGHIEARWEYTPESLSSGISISRVEETKGKGKEEEADPFADDNPTSPALPADQQWVDVKVVKKITSGKYEAK
ncbi:fes cip4 domain-containing protein [Colletotrichum truncatum]|uniref:Fes cip4 domain-containing protein n=1 Tax=Colletotrichum truncatum TaxID=5467 RepID=A0ACC3YF15_COLTU|nr:fes cip4 domain-containing protein [Colletotrichum truncatum]KAF6784983.1 fes cip4 domain-containing protein [Colletotrichum truncatum]